MQLRFPRSLDPFAGRRVPVPKKSRPKNRSPSNRSRKNGRPRRDPQPPIVLLAVLPAAAAVAAVGADEVAAGASRQ